MGKLFVTDEGHWITINGNHVLINEKGEVQSGMGGALKGVKLSKPKSNMKGKLSSAKKEYEQHDKKFGARYKSEFDRHNRALERINKEQERLDKEHENDWQEKDRDTYMKKRAELRKAEAELDGKKRDEDTKNESKLKQIGERSGYEKKGIYLKKEGVKKALSSARSKLKSAREANAYIANAKGTKVSKATPEMVGGKFTNPKQAEQRSLAWGDYAKEHFPPSMAKNEEERRALEQNFARSRKWANAYKRKDKAARATLAKARPKIAERRQAVKAYNEREDEKIAKAMGLGKYRKPYYETDAFKSGKKSDYI